MLSTFNSLKRIFCRTNSTKENQYEVDFHPEENTDNVYFDDEDENKHSDYLSVNERIRGVVFGQAIGDSLGSGTEFQLKPTHVTGLYPAFGYPHPVFTDDTQMMLAVAESILEHDGTIEDFMKKLKVNFIKWLHGDERWGRNDRSPGVTCMRSVGNLNSGAPWVFSGEKEWGKGNGSAMRSSIIGAAFYYDPDKAFEYGCMSSVITHNNVESILAAGAVAYLVAMLISDCSFEDAFAGLMQKMNSMEKAETYTDQGSARFAIAWLASAFAYRDTMTLSEFVQWNGNDGKGLEAVAAAIFFKDENYTKSVLNAANWADDSDSVAAITGALSGAELGVGAIPSSWIQNIEKTSYLMDVADRINEYAEKNNKEK